MNMSRSMCTNAARIMVAAGAVMVVVACSDSIGPESIASGQYELHQLGGATLPVRYLTYGFGGQSYRNILGGNLKFISGSRVVEVRRVSDQPQGTEPFEFDYVDTAAYEVEGDMIIIDRPGIPGQLAPHSDTAVVDGDVLFMPVRTVEGEVPLVRMLTYLRPQ